MADYRHVMALLVQGRPYRQIESMAACSHRTIAKARSVLDDEQLTTQEQIDVLTADVPYVPTSAIETLPPEARLHEPRVALDGGPDGLDVARRVLREAPEWLAPGGSVLIEASPAQASSLAAEGLAVRIETEDDTAVLVAASAGS